MIPGTDAGSGDTAFANYAIALSVGTATEFVSASTQGYPKPKNQPKNPTTSNGKAKSGYNGCMAPDG